MNFKLYFIYILFLISNLSVAQNTNKLSNELNGFSHIKEYLTSSITYELTLKNYEKISPTEFQFDIFLKNTSTEVFEYSLGQYSISINPKIKPSPQDTIKFSMISGSCNLTNNNQAPKSFAVQGDTLLKIATSSLVGSGNGSKISTNGYGTKIGRFKVTCTSPFSEMQTPNLNWRDVSNGSGFITKIFAYIGGITTEITNPTCHYEDIDYKNLGQYWENYSKKQYYIQLYEATFLTNDIAFISGGKGTVLRSTNKGITWDSIYTGISNALYSITFNSNGVGLAVGSKGKIVRSTNSGLNWSEIKYSSSGNNLQDVAFDPTNPNIALACGWGYMYRTTDAGLTWKPTEIINLDYLVLTFYSVKFVTKDIVLTSASNGVIERSTNGGLNWTVISNDGGATYNLSGLAVIPGTQTAVAAGYEFIKSTDSGMNWGKVHEEETYYCYDLGFANNSLGFAVGFLGKISKTTNAGATWDSIYIHPNGEDDGVFFSGIGFSPNGRTAITVGYKMLESNQSIILRSSSEGIYYNSTSTKLSHSNTKIISPAEYKLYQNYPNPFNPNTVISYSIPKQEFVKIKIYNMVGQEVAVLVNQVQDKGDHAVQFNGGSIPSGIYFYMIETSEFTETKKMTLLK